MSRSIFPYFMAPVTICNKRHNNCKSINAVIGIDTGDSANEVTMSHEFIKPLKNLGRLRLKSYKQLTSAGPADINETNDLQICIKAKNIKLCGNNVSFDLSPAREHFIMGSKLLFKYKCNVDYKRRKLTCGNTTFKLRFK